MKMRIMVRGFLRGEKVFEQPVNGDSESLDFDQVIALMAEKHATAMAEGRLGMIEFEFLDDPNPADRFLRIGVDPSGMVIPIAFEN